MALHTLPGQRADTYIYHNYNGFYYHYSDVAFRTLYFKCDRYGRGCRGRAILYSDDFFFESSPHNHDQDYDKWQVILLRNRILLSVAEEPYLSFRDIVYREGRRFPIVIRAQVPPVRIRHAMARVRNHLFPDVPQTLHDLAEYLQDPQYAFLTACEDSGGHLLPHEVYDADGHCHLILISERMLPVMEGVRWLFGDGHFASRPTHPNLSQIFNFVLVWDHHVIFLGCALMESRTENAYRSVFEGLKYLMPALDPEFIACDHEVAQQNGWAWAFPQARIVGCLWHYCRAIVRKALSLGLGPWVRRSRLWRRMLRMCCALPLFPQNLMLQALLQLMLECFQNGVFIFRSFWPLYQYLYNEWIINPVRNFSVYGCEHRTSNAVECVNRWMRHEVGVHHPGTFLFLAALVRMEGISFSALTSLRQGISPARERRTSALSNDRRIANLTADLEQQPLGLTEAIHNLLLYGANTLRQAYNDLIQFEEREEYHRL